MQTIRHDIILGTEEWQGYLRVIGTELDDERSVFRTALKCICPGNLMTIIQIIINIIVKIRVKFVGIIIVKTIVKIIVKTIIRVIVRIIVKVIIKTIIGIIIRIDDILSVLH